MPTYADVQDAHIKTLTALLEQVVSTFRRVQKNLPEVDKFDPTVDPLLIFYEDLVHQLRYKKEGKQC